MGQSICQDAIDAAGDRAWILRAALDHCGDETAITHILRNVTCAAMRKAIAAMPTDGALKIPTARAAVITLLHNVVRHLRAYGYVETASVCA